VRKELVAAAARRLGLPRLCDSFVGRSGERRVDRPVEKGQEVLLKAVSTEEIANG